MVDPVVCFKRNCRAHYPARQHTRPPSSHLPHAKAAWRQFDVVHRWGDTSWIIRCKSIHPPPAQTGKSFHEKKPATSPKFNVAKAPAKMLVWKTNYSQILLGLGNLSGANCLTLGGGNMFTSFSARFLVGWSSPQKSTKIKFSRIPRRGKKPNSTSFVLGSWWVAGFFETITKKQACNFLKSGICETNYRYTRITWSHWRLASDDKLVEENIPSPMSFHEKIGCQTKQRNKISRMSPLWYLKKHLWFDVNFLRTSSCLKFLTWAFFRTQGHVSEGLCLLVRLGWRLPSPHRHAITTPTGSQWKETPQTRLQSQLQVHEGIENFLSLVV